MKASQWVQPFIAVLISALIATRAYRRKSLNFSGALSGFIVMSLHIALGYRFGAMLLVFFFTSSKLTKVGEEKKRRVDPEFKEGGQRNWLQVLSNSGLASVLVVIVRKLTEGQDKCLNSKDSPVRRGTNGGVTKAGLLAAAAAGSLIGLSFVLLGFLTTRCEFDIALKQLLVIPISALAGLCGSVIDSLLGATLQFSGFCTVRNKVVGKPGPTVKKISGLTILDNNAVNLVAILLTTVLTSVACSYIF